MLEVVHVLCQTALVRVHQRPDSVQQNIRECNFLSPLSTVKMSDNFARSTFNNFKIFKIIFPPVSSWQFFPNLHRSRPRTLSAFSSINFPYPSPSPIPSFLIPFPVLFFPCPSPFARLACWLRPSPKLPTAKPRWGVVQPVGHLTVNEDGEGSNPSAPANFSPSYITADFSCFGPRTNSCATLQIL